MSIKDKYTVKSINSFECKEWLLYKHYAKAVPNIMYSFGLLENKILQGICCYGTPANNNNNNLDKYKQIELVRLCINDNLEKNVLSFFVSKTFNLLPKPLSLISYADEGQSHNGYIYQATNWIYTGKGGGVDFYLTKDNKQIHSRIMSDYRLKYPNKTRKEIAEMLNWTKVKGTYKHRYFYFIGTKFEKKDWKNKLLKKYKNMPYPKGENKRYDTSYKTTIQTKLF